MFLVYDVKSENCKMIEMRNVSVLKNWVNVQNKMNEIHEIFLK